MRDGAVALELLLEHGHTSFEPGSRVGGVAHWSARTAPAGLELALIWTSLGWGGRDLKIVDTVTFSEPLAEERRPFIIALPVAPYSFQGALITLSWALELTAFPGHDKVRVDLVIAPGRRTIDLR